MRAVFFLSSMVSMRFSAVFRCEVERPVELPNGPRTLMISCDPPVDSQELLQICLPDVVLPGDGMPAKIAWGEIYETEADARMHELAARPSERAPRHPDCPRRGER